MSNTITNVLQQEWKELLFLIRLQQARLSQDKLRELVDKFVENSQLLENGNYHIPYLFELTPMNWRDLNVINYYLSDCDVNYSVNFSLYLKVINTLKRYRKRKAYSYLSSCIDAVIEGLTQSHQVIYIDYDFPFVTINLSLLTNPEYLSDLVTNVKFIISTEDIKITFSGITYHFTMSELRDTPFSYVLNSLYWQCNIIKCCQRKLKQHSELITSIGAQM